MPPVRVLAALALGLVVAGSVAAALLRDREASDELPCGMEPLAFWHEPGVRAALAAAGAREAGPGPGIPLDAPDLAAWGALALREVARHDGAHTFSLEAREDGFRAWIAVPEGDAPAGALADALEGLTPASRAEREAAAEGLRRLGAMDTPRGRLDAWQGPLDLPLDATPLYEALSMRAARVGDPQAGFRALEWGDATLFFRLGTLGLDVPLDDAVARVEADAGDRVLLRGGARVVTVRLDGGPAPGVEDLARDVLARVGLPDARLDGWHPVANGWECAR